MITSSDRSRLEKLLNMLGSQFDGERATAGAMIAKMAAGHKMTIVQLCLSPVQPAEQKIYQSPYQEREYPKPAGGPTGYRDPGFYEFHSKEKGQDEEWLKKAREKKQKDWERFKVIRDSLTYIKQNFFHYLNEWEQGFVNNIVMHPPYQTLTEKQFEVAKNIIDRTIKRAEANGE